MKGAGKFDIDAMAAMREIDALKHRVLALEIAVRALEGKPPIKAPDPSEDTGPIEGSDIEP